jgi:hypothetical protein
VRLTGTTFNGELYDSRAVPAEFKPGQIGFSLAGQTVAIW